MRKILKCVAGVAIAFSLNTASAEVPYHAPIEKAVYECGDLSTAIAHIASGAFLGAVEEMDVEVAAYQSAVNYFFTRLRACECRAALEGEAGLHTKVACFYQSKALAMIYYFLMNVDVESSTDLDSLLSEELLEGLLSDDNAQTIYGE